MGGKRFSESGQRDRILYYICHTNSYYGTAILGLARNEVCEHIMMAVHLLIINNWESVNQLLQYQQLNNVSSRRLHPSQAN